MSPLTLLLELLLRLCRVLVLLPRHCLFLLSVSYSSLLLFMSVSNRN